jgi:tetratricopeptide (TPR) repeat protein
MYEIFRQVMQELEKLLGREHPDILLSEYHLADVIRKQGLYKAAEKISRQKLQVQERVLGPKHPSTLTSMNSLATLLHCQGKHDEAETMHRQALGVKEVVLGSGHPSTLAIMNNLAAVLRSQGKYDEAGRWGFKRWCWTQSNLQWDNQGVQQGYWLCGRGGTVVCIGQLITKIIHHIISALSYLQKPEAYHNGAHHNAEAVRALRSDNGTW